MDFYNQIFDQNSALPEQWSNHDFEQCTFKKLDLAKALLEKTSFTNCHFEHCNLTGVQLKYTKLDDVTFSSCQLGQVDFGLCNPFGFRVAFQECQLDYTIFLNRNLKKTRFISCSLKEAHFLKCDLAGAVFKDCNLELAKLAENNLTQADFSTSYNLRLDPDDNKVKKARFSLYNLPGLLTKYDITVVEK